MLQVVNPIDTERLVVRPFVTEDLDALSAIQGRDEVTPFLHWGARDREQVRVALALNIERTRLGAEGDVLSLAVVLRESGQLVGDLTFFYRSEKHRQGEIGFLFHPDHHGCGYATEASRVLLRLGFEQLGLHRIFGRLDARNGASARVLEKLGMRREAHLIENEIVKGEWTDELIYALLRRDWDAAG